MQFGFTLKPDHTIERTLALTRQADPGCLGTRLGPPRQREGGAADSDEPRNSEPFSLLRDELHIKVPDRRAAKEGRHRCGQAPRFLTARTASRCGSVQSTFRWVRDLKVMKDR